MAKKFPFFFSASTRELVGSVLCGIIVITLISFDAMVPFKTSKNDVVVVLTITIRNRCVVVWVLGS